MSIYKVVRLALSWDLFLVQNLWISWISWERKLNFSYKLEKTGYSAMVFLDKLTRKKCTRVLSKLNKHNSYLIFSISSSIIFIVSCKLHSLFSIFLLGEKQTVCVIRKNNSNKTTEIINLTSVYSDSHLDLTFLWLEPKLLKRLRNCKTPILTNLRIKYQEKI